MANTNDSGTCVMCMYYPGLLVCRCLRLSASCKGGGGVVGGGELLCQLVVSLERAADRVRRSCRRCWKWSIVPIRDVGGR